LSRLLSICAGKRKRGQTTKGSRWLRQVLTQAAWAASHTKGTYLAAQHRRLAGRRGKKRALVALGHTLLVTMYQLLKDGTTYQELGADYLDRLEPERLTRYFVKPWNVWVIRSRSSPKRVPPEHYFQGSRRMTRAAFWPPKPKLVDRAVRTGTSRAALGT
jgi:hypothetical protein